MKTLIKIAVLSLTTVSTAAYAATPGAVAAACCALGVCCGMPCCDAAMMAM